MKKQELLATAEKSNSKSFGLRYDESGIVLYRSQQYRWENSADPEVDDVEYHLTTEDAIDAAKSINCNLGFYPIVEKLFIAKEQLEDIEDEEEVELEELAYKFRDIANVWDGPTNEGEDIKGAIIVEWAWRTYVGYAHDFKSIGRAGDSASFYNLKKEVDLITGNEESTFKSNFSVLLAAEEIADLTDEELLQAVNDALSSESWKWNRLPSDAVIIESLELNIGADPK